MNWETFTLTHEHGKPLELETILSGILSPATLGLLSPEEKEISEDVYQTIFVHDCFRKFNHKARMNILRKCKIMHKYLKNKWVLTNHTRTKIRRRIK